MALPYILDYNIPPSYTRISELSSIFDIRPKGIDARTLARMIPGKIIELLRDLEMPTTLREINFPKTDIETFADYIFEARQKLYDLSRFNPRRLSKENTRRLIKNMYEGNFENAFYPKEA
jgi:alcohol dehydrogenase class IV